MNAPRDDDFFIGWSNRLPAAMRLPMIAAAAIMVCGLAALGYGLSRAADDPGDALLKLGPRTATGEPTRPQEWQGDQIFTGRLETKGYSLLHVGPDAAFPRGRVLLLSGFGKRGPEIAGAAGLVELRGGLMRRGDLEMLVVEGPAKPIALDSAGAELSRQSLGRWRISGEICDGKCYAGGMRPGSGVSHRACAVLCLAGDIPPVFVTYAPVAGQSFLIVAAPDGASPYSRISNVIGIPVEVEGEVERVGNVLILQLDPGKVRRL
jgi:hypothetical protein